MRAYAERSRRCIKMQRKIKPEDIPYAVSGEEKFEMQLTVLF